MRSHDYDYEKDTLLYMKGNHLEVNIKDMTKKEVLTKRLRKGMDVGGLEWGCLRHIYRKGSLGKGFGIIVQGRNIRPENKLKQ